MSGLMTSGERGAACSSRPGPAAPSPRFRVVAAAAALRSKCSGAPRRAMSHAPARACQRPMLRTTALLLLAAPGAAYACGCFTPPDPSVPVVQAGEKILFAVKDGQVTAHVQVQYEGDAADFGWLLPLPSVPTLELGVDELFTQLTTATQPKYRMNTAFDQNCLTPPGGGTGGGSSGFFDAGS